MMHAPAAHTVKALAMTALFAAVGVSAFAAPQAELWPRWEAHDAGSERSVDHSGWARFLDRYLVTQTGSGAHLLRYGEVSEADHERLRRYVGGLEEIAVSSLSRPEQFAYWVNLYNALTVRVVLDNYPVESIRDIGGLFRQGPWDTKYLDIEGASVSLNDIEHRILRPIWEDPRIHYAVNCAAMGCPNLQPMPFTPQNTERLLERGAAAFVNSPRGARFTPDGTLVLSSIYDWYRSDFGGSRTGILDHLLRYADDGLASRLRDYEGEIRYRYDWGLNKP